MSAFSLGVTNVMTETRLPKRIHESLWVWLFLGSMVILCFFGSSDAQEITEQGQRLAKLLDSVDVEHLWLAHQYVDWRTGRPKDKPVSDSKPHTHCSAFVAAAAAKLNIYILRPPEHSAAMLANPQADWLLRQGKENGWRAVGTAEEAQRLANRGILVVAVYKEPALERSGHIAIVRPHENSPKRIQEEGPQVTQAGMENYTSTSLKEGFRHHKRAWERGEVQFFSHEVDWRIMAKE